MAGATYAPKRVTMAGALRQMREGAGTYKGIWSWIATVDHKRIGVLYGVTRVPRSSSSAASRRCSSACSSRRRTATLLNPDQYNRIFTMHGTTMVFLVVMPLSAAFFNLLVPLMIGARDVAFPRLNAFSYWVFLLGGLFMNASFFTGGNIFEGELGAPDAGWFGYAPLTLNAVLARQRHRLLGARHCRSSAFRRWPVASTSSSRSSTCARRA